MNNTDIWQKYYIDDIDSWVHDCSNSIANALELLQSCSKPSICRFKLVRSPLLSSMVTGTPSVVITPDRGHTVLQVRQHSACYSHYVFVMYWMCVGIEQAVSCSMPALLCLWRVIMLWSMGWSNGPTVACLVGICYSCIEFGGTWILFTGILDKTL